TAGSEMLDGYESPIEATAVRRLREAGGTVVGKTNLDEFAMGASTETSHVGATENPRAPGHVAGGSSGGSAAAVAAGICPVALGSDTGGSVRQPASHCGVVGFKPSYGRVSRRGLVAHASSLDQIGVLARTVEGAARVFEVIGGSDGGDATTVDRAVPEWRPEHAGDVDGTVVGVPRSWFEGEHAPREPVEEAVRRGLESLESAGCEVREVELPSLEYAVAAYYVVATAEASSNLARYDGVRFGHRAEETEDLEEMYARSRAEGFGDEVRRRIILGTFVLSEGHRDDYYGRACRVREQIAGEFERAFEEVDVVAGPTAPTTAWPLGEDRPPLEMYLQDVYTTPANLARLPAMSVPCAETDEGLPVGLQLVGRRFGESELFDVARAVEGMSRV
ncbi:MAG: Asp-tRNA(Asn)/Glu-tRNA(Gln) amidotransferase subunit GatA, partial [Bradymonadaceae bacterium]